MKMPKSPKPVLIMLLLFILTRATGQTAPVNFQNPILPGFNPDPSVCRVGNDYYMVTSSFVWFPGIPIYHSKDLVNWQLIGHGITRTNEVDFNNVKDKNGIWAVTIRYHDGLFYLITTASECGGNFYITAKNPAGPWSNPVWLKDAPGIDASLFWDDDGKCYYTGNRYDFPKAWPNQSGIWLQELNLATQTLIGGRKMLTYGHAATAAATEGPHLYKIDGKYLLLTAEGGTDTYHAITAHHSNTLFGPYVADKINPVLSHRQLGGNYPIQAVGHGDLVQTQNGDWWAVVLGKQLINGQAMLTRETFLCKVQFENGTPIFNPGDGRVLGSQPRPALPWAPVAPTPVKDEFKGDSLALGWYFIRMPVQKNYRLTNNGLQLQLARGIADSAVHTAMIIKKLKGYQFTATTKLNFKTAKSNEQAGLIIYRNTDSYYMLLKDKAGLVLIKKDGGKKEVIAQMPYTQPVVYLKAVAANLDVSFSFGQSADQMTGIGPVQSLKVISESPLNRFNGPGIGVYATANGVSSTNRATFQWFEYQPGQ